MISIQCARRGRFVSWPIRESLLGLLPVAVAALVIAPGFTTARASAIFGTLSNFDIYFTSPDPTSIPGCEGAEIELEGVHSSSIGGDFPAHYANKAITEYTDSTGNFAGTRITYTGYNFSLAPTPGTLLHNSNPVSTNGHQLTYTAGGEHFGFWLNGAQPTATRFFWLDDVGNSSYTRIGNTPLPIPGPTWVYVPPANQGDAPRVQAVVQVPEAEDPPQDPQQRPDSVWMKVFKVKLSNAPQDPVEMQNLLLQLISDADPNNNAPDVPVNDIVPEGDDPAEVETEWELLEGGKAPKQKVDEDQIDEQNDKTIIRRYEFYKYTGVYDDEHEALSQWEAFGDPNDPGLDVFDNNGNLIFAGELGDFISANMVGAILNPIPEPASLSLLLAGLVLISQRRSVPGRPRA